MADFAANLNTARQFTTARPSIFDLLAQDSLRTSLQPAFDFVLKTLSTRYPVTFGKFEQYSDELFHLLLVVVERYFIWNHSASFSEHFYGLTRVRMTRKDDPSSLSTFQKVASILCLTLVPYLKRKLERIYLQVKEEMVYHQAGINSMKFTHNIVQKFYPYIHGSAEAAKLVLTICYIVNLTDFHSLTHGCFKMILRFTGDFTSKQNGDMGNIWETFKNSRMQDILRILPYMLKQGYSLAMEYALPVTVFFLKFLEWWYSSENSPHNTMNSRTLPPPPLELQESCNDQMLHTTPQQCALCFKPHQNPTALSRSGYVFCYTCIYKFVDENRCCPLTNLECSLDDLIRLHV